MKVAIVGAGFTPAEADALRRSMATFKLTGGVSHFRDKMIDGMIANGYTRDFAERTFRQIEGFGSYGFPESHAASFAKIAYASSWMKCHHPDIFCAALLNAQPMGFYQPAQIVRDAEQHGVEVRPVCVNRSGWDTELEGEIPPLLLQGRNGRNFPLRLGLRMTSGLAQKDAEAILLARASAPFASIEDVWMRSSVPRIALEKLAQADAFHGLGLSRRQALWQVRGLRDRALPLFAAAGVRETEREPEVKLRAMTEGREVVEDYSSLSLSLRGHPVAFLREELDRKRVTRCADLARLKDGSRVEVAGIVLIRQRPGNGNVTFITIEDETGVANIILWQRKFEAQRRIVMSAPMIGVKGLVQREGQVIHIVTERLEDYGALLGTVGERDFPHRVGRADGAKNGAYDPRIAKKQRAQGQVDASPMAPALSLPLPAPELRLKSRNFH